VTPEQVRDAARRYLDKRQSVTGYLIREGAPREEKKS
jgi:zinc protease